MTTTTRHPDDPRPLREQFARTFPFVKCEPGPDNNGAIQAVNKHDWKPACWLRPLDRWWDGDLPLGPPPVAERWPTCAPNTRGRAR